MDEVATKIIEILRKNMKDPSKPVALETPLSELEIEFARSRGDRVRY